MKNLSVLLILCTCVLLVHADAVVYDSDSGVFARSNIGSPTYYYTNTLTGTNTKTPAVYWQNAASGGYDYRVWFRFELPEISDINNVSQVTLSLTAISNTYVGYPVHVLYDPTQDTVSMYPSGSNVAVHPAYRPTSGATDFVVTSAGYLNSTPTTYDIDVTSIIQYAYANNLQYAWFTIYSTVQSPDTSHNTWQSTWGTHNNTTEDYRASLTIVPEPATMGLLMAGSVIVLIRRRR